MTILCQSDAPTAATLGDVLDAEIRAVDAFPAAALLLANGADENLVVIGSTAALDDSLEFTRQVHKARPDVAVVLLRDEVVPEQEIAAVAAGVREVVRSDDPVAIGEACRRAWVTIPVRALASAKGAGDGVPAGQAEARTGRVVTVFAPKGGSGKTTLATNLAVALNRHGARVVLVDLDLEFGDVAIALRLAPQRTSVDAVSAETERADGDLVDLVTTGYSPGLDCVLAPIEPGHAERVTASLVGRLLTQLKLRYNYVVVDTPSQFTDQVLAALDQSERHVLISNPEIPSVKNLRLTLDMFDLLGYEPQSRVLVFNRADAAAGLSADEVQRTLGAEFAGSVPASRDVPLSINRGVPIVAATPDHPVSAAIDEIARRFVMDEQPPARRGLFGRLKMRRSA